MPATPSQRSIWWKKHWTKVALAVMTLAFMGAVIDAVQGEAAAQAKPEKTVTAPVSPKTEKPQQPTYAPTACAQKKGPSSLGALKPVKPAWRTACMSLERQPAYVIVQADGSQVATPDGKALVLECRTDEDPYGCFKAWVKDYEHATS